MLETKVQLNTPLTKDDVELRIGTTSENGFSLLIYKTARTDIKRLTDVFGLLWKNKHFYDAKDLLCCEISIKVEDEWVGRSDVGVESREEKEKGSYSDSFKRAGFRWGIGLELYRSPFIWINWDMKQNPKGKGYIPLKFYASNLTIKDYKVKDGIPHLTIKYQNKAIFSNLGADIGKIKTTKPKNTQIKDPITEIQKKHLDEALQFLPIKEAGLLTAWLEESHSHSEATAKIKEVNTIADEISNR